MDELQCRSTAHRVGSTKCQFHGAVDHRTQLLPPQHLKRKPQLQHIEAAGSEQRIGHQVGNALLFMRLGIEVVSVQFDEFEMTSFPQQESAGRNRLPEEFVKIDAQRVRGCNALQLFPVAM